MRRSGGGVLVAGTAACVLALAGPAAAQKATIGSDLKGTPNSSGFGCGMTGDPCAIQQLTLPGNPHPTKAPFSGDLRKWRFRTTFAGATYRLRIFVVRRTPSGKFRFVAHTKRRTIGPAAGTYVFRDRVPIRKGDYIALEIPADFEGMQFIVDDPGATDNEWFPTPALNQPTAADPLTANTDAEYLYNATIRR